MTVGPTVRRHVMLNNGQLGKISKEQAAGEWEVWQTSLHNPKAMAYDGPAMVEVMTDPNLV